MFRTENVDFHTIDKSLPTTIDGAPDPIVTTEKGFTTGSQDGKPVEIATDHIDCYAKVEFVPEERGGPIMIHAVKVGMGGFIFDPWGIFSEGSQAKEAVHAGRSAWQFHKVTKFCFDQYILYLMTRNKAFYNQAGRELRSNA